MPTVPVIITATRFPQTGPSGATGWRLAGHVNNPITNRSGASFGNGCQPLTNGFFGWGDGDGATVSGLSVSPTTPVAHSGINSQIEYTTGTYTYPSGDAIKMEGQYYSSGASYTHSLGLGVGLVTGVLGYTNLNASVADPLSSTAQATVNFKFYSADITINGDLFYELWERIQWRAGGVVYEINLSGLTKITVNEIAYLTYRNSSTLNVDTIQVHTFQYTGTVQFPLSAMPLEVRLGNAYGEWQAWNTIKFVPAGTLSTSVEDDEVTLDARGVYVIGGQIHDTNGLRYTFSNGSIPQPYFTDQNLIDYDVSAAGLDDGDTLATSLQATSQAGCVANFSNGAIVEGGRISAHHDSNGITLAAVKSESTPGALDIAYFDDGGASRQVVATIPNAKNPSLFQIPGGSRFYLVHQNTE